MVGHPIPIERIDNVDILALKKDGSVELKIISAGFLDNDQMTIDRFLTKLNNYLEYINSEEFIEEFGKPEPNKVVIYLNCNTPPHPEIVEMIESIKPQVEEWNASIELEVKE